MPYCKDWIPQYPSVRDRCIYIATLYESGLSVHEIARRMSISVSSVYRCLKPGKLLIAAERAALAEAYTEQLRERERTS